MLCGIGILTVLVYRSGGGWTGRALSYAIILQYWSAITAFLLPGIVATTPPARPAQVEYDPLVVVRPTLGRAVTDALTRLLALLLPVVIVGIGGSIFFMLRLADTAHAHFNSVDRPNPLTIETLWLVFLIGPLPGSAAQLALSEVGGADDRAGDLARKATAYYPEYNIEHRRRKLFPDFLGLEPCKELAYE